MRVSQPQKLGEHGSDLIQDTNQHNGVWYAITIIEAATMTTLTDVTQSLVGVLTSISFAAGVTMHGIFTTITLSDGAVIAYKLRDS